MKICTEDEYFLAERRYAVLCMAGSDDDVDDERDALFAAMTEWLDGKTDAAEKVLDIPQPIEPTAQERQFFDTLKWAWDQVIRASRMPEALVSPPLSTTGVVTSEGGDDAKEGDA